MLWLVHMVVQVSVVTGWLGLDIALLNPVLSQNGFGQRFSKPPLEVGPDPWT